MNSTGYVLLNGRMIMNNEMRNVKE